ncbi:MAG: hypothetical protein QOD38_1326, partial [Acidimicrobiaceae bacterium]
MNRGIRLLAVAFLSLGVAALPHAASATPTQTRSDILQLVSQTPVVEPDGDLTIRLRVTGAPVGARLRVEVHSRVPTRSDFKATLAGRVSRPRVAGPFVSPAATDASGIAVVTVTTHDLQSEGVYPVTIDLLTDKGAPLDSLLTFMVRMPLSREF